MGWVKMRCPLRLLDQQRNGEKALHCIRKGFSIYYRTAPQKIYQVFTVSLHQYGGGTVERKWNENRKGLWHSHSRFILFNPTPSTSLQKTLSLTYEVEEVSCGSPPLGISQHVCLPVCLYFTFLPADLLKRSGWNHSAGINRCPNRTVIARKGEKNLKMFIHWQASRFIPMASLCRVNRLESLLWQKLLPIVLQQKPEIQLQWRS